MKMKNPEKYYEATMNNKPFALIRKFFINNYNQELQRGYLEITDYRENYDKIYEEEKEKLLEIYKSTKMKESNIF